MARFSGPHDRSQMKRFLASSLATLIFSIVIIFLSGESLGGLFALVVVVVVLAPTFAATRQRDFLGPLGVVTGVCLAALLPFFRDTIDAGQFTQVLVLLATFA